MIVVVAQRRPAPPPVANISASCRGCTPRAERREIATRHSSGFTDGRCDSRRSADRGSGELAVADATANAFLRLDLQAHDLWGLSATAGGTRVVYRLMHRGDWRMIVHDEVVLRVGAPAAFALSIDGQEGRVLGQTVETVAGHITPQNYRQFPRRSTVARVDAKSWMPTMVLRHHLSASVTRTINRETVVLLGWGRAILLQLAHPLVAAGVADYSGFRNGVHGYMVRVRHTVGAMLALTFGTEADVRMTAARINAVHSGVRGTLREPVGVFPVGTGYSARNPELLAWVHATLVDSMLVAYEQFVGPLTGEEQDQYCAEASVMGPLLGIPEGILPGSRSALNAYLDKMFGSDQIQVAEQARMVARSLLTPPIGPIATPFLWPVRLITLGLLPAAIRNAYGFPWDARDERNFRRVARVVKRARSFLPVFVREWPAARANRQAA